MGSHDRIFSEHPQPAGNQLAEMHLSNSVHHLRTARRRRRNLGPIRQPRCNFEANCSISGANRLAGKLLDELGKIARWFLLYYFGSERIDRLINLFPCFFLKFIVKYKVPFSFSDAVWSIYPDCICNKRIKTDSWIFGKLYGFLEYIRTPQDVGVEDRNIS